MQDAAEGNRQVAYLNDIDDLYQVAAGYPDIRGWSVLARDRRRLGKVSDLPVNTEQMKVRYVEVELDERLRLGGARDERYTLIPIGAARVHGDTGHVLVDIDAAGAPMMRRRAHAVPLEREEELRLLAPYRAGTAEPGDDFYADARFDEGAAFLPNRRTRPRPLGYIRRP
jgi:hypothetical protein